MFTAKYGVAFQIRVIGLNCFHLTLIVDHRNVIGVLLSLKDAPPMRKI